MYIHWDPSFETGQPLIDAQHRMLVFLFQKLNVAVKTGESQMTTNHVIGELKRFVEFHFSSEENLMRETGYPHLPAHQVQHMELLVELGALVTKVLGGREFPEDLVYFLNKWLVEHISSHDQHVALHILDATTRPIAEHSYGEYIGVRPGPSVSG